MRVRLDCDSLDKGQRFRYRGRFALVSTAFKAALGFLEAPDIPKGWKLRYVEIRATPERGNRVYLQIEAVSPLWIKAAKARRQLRTMAPRREACEG